MSSIFTGGGIKSIQNISGSFTIANTGATVQTLDVSISNVDVSKSVLVPTIIPALYGTNSLSMVSMYIYVADYVRIQWVASTNSTIRYSFQVVEFE